MSRGDRKAIIVRDRPDLSLSRQCRLLSIARSSVYYAAKGESPANLALMRRIDELFLKYPFYGSLQMARQLRREGIHAGHHRVRRLMRASSRSAVSTRRSPSCCWTSTIGRCAMSDAPGQPVDLTQ